MRSYKKYKNNYGWCKYPFDNSGLGYCWGFAIAVDEKINKKGILKMCNKKVGNKNLDTAKALGLKKGDYWCEFYKPILK